MTEKLKQTIEEEIAQLPKEMQEVINSFGWIKVAEEIGNENKLNEEEVEDLQLETLLVLIGVVNLEFYAVNIENHVNTTTELAKKIASEGFTKIFIPIRKTLEDNIKKNMSKKNPSWNQNIDFIMSDGDYSVFMENRENESPENLPMNRASAFSTTPPTLADIKANAQRTNTSTGNPKMTDIRPVVQPPQGSTSGVKSKFTI